MAARASETPWAGRPENTPCFSRSAYSIVVAQSVPEKQHSVLSSEDVGSLEAACEPCHVHGQTTAPHVACTCHMYMPMSKHTDMCMYMQHTQTHAFTLGLVHAIVRPGIARLTLRCTHTCSHACPTHTLARHTIQGSGSACPSSLGSRSLGPRSLLLRLHRLRSFAVAAAHAAARATCTAPARAAPAHAAPAHAAPARAAPARPTWRPADTEGWIGARGSMPGSACAVEAAAHMNSPNTARGAWSR